MDFSSLCRSFRTLNSFLKRYRDVKKISHSNINVIFEFLLPEFFEDAQISCVNVAFFIEDIQIACYIVIPQSAQTTSVVKGND